mgnify:CR=1 FL=1
MEKWICNKCRNEIFEKPYKNQTCKLNGCKGRFKHFKRCECGKWFEVNYYDKEYCSHECCRNSAKSKINAPKRLECINCGKEFVRAYGNIKKGSAKHFCCRDCKKEYEKRNRIVRVCKQCGKEFVVTKSVIGEGTNVCKASQNN